MERQFTSGSRQAPDPFDQFLEENHFYRKHTARDASCLFRVISEQMYDTQLHHLVIRERCVSYMRKHRSFFASFVDRDLDEYLDDLSKPKTYGTFVELQAVGYMFQRNILLFEPFNLGSYFKEYQPSFSEVFRVFYTPERHFDSVFTSEYIQDAAICQSICYEILYKDLFKLPDVSFAVEQMLHASSFESVDCRTETNEDGYCTRIQLSDGRCFDFDLPENTNCILENYKLCHFHYPNFPHFSDDLQRELKVTHREEMDKNVLLSRTAESFLPNKYVSCVRQLLQEGITPFPYKVAKALDPNMYRNIEFDSWNEARKELKLQNWYNGDSNFKVGAKCHVKLRKSEQDLYTCHIQEIAVDKGYCIVFIEQLGEKRLVPYDSLTPLPPDQFKPWTLPYRFQRQMQKYSSVRFTRHCNYRLKLNSTHHEFCAGEVNSGEGHDAELVGDGDPKTQQQQQQQHYASATAAASFYKLKQYTHLENFRTHTVEYCTMPLTVEHAACNVESKCAPRVTPINDNSRASSRTSTAVSAVDAHVKTENDSSYNETADDGTVTPVLSTATTMENYEPDQNSGAIYMPELQCFYPVHSYAGGLPEECYGYAYDGGMQPPAAAFLAPGNSGGAIYYVCSAPGTPGTFIPTGSTTSNPYLQAPPPNMQPPLLPSVGVPGGGYYSNPYYGGGAGLSTSVLASQLGPSSTLPSQATNAHQAEFSTPARSRGANASTPLTGRINWEAKKSVKATGADLPTDIATLRYFYNLGLDCHHKYLKRTGSNNNNSTNEQGAAIVDTQEQMAKVASDFQRIKLDENANQIEPKADSNKNSITSKIAGDGSHPCGVQNTLFSNQGQSSQISGNVGNSNIGGGGGGGGGGVGVGGNSSGGGNKSNQRRFSSRYFNNKERVVYQRNNTNLSSNSNTTSHSHQQPARNHNAQNVKHTNSSNNLNATSNLSRNSQHHQQFSVTEQGIQTSPMVTYDSVPLIGDNAASGQTPTSYNPTQNPIVTYGAYDYVGDSNNTQQGSSLPATAAGGVYIQMPMAHPHYGLYAPQFPTVPPPPPPLPALPPSQQAGLGLHPTYMGPVPSMHGGPPSSTGSENAESYVKTDVGAGVSVGGMHFPCMSYPPPMPFFYSPSNGIPSGAGGGISSTGGVNLLPHPQPLPPMQSSTQHLPAPVPPSVPPPHTATLGPQAYWCMPPPTSTPLPAPMPPQLQPSPTQASVGAGGGGGTNTGTSGIVPQTLTQTGGSGSGGSNHNNNNIRRDKQTQND